LPVLVLAATELAPVSWDSLWTVEGLVALGTILLAAATAFLAWRTSAMAGKTAKLAEFTEKELSALLEQLEVSREQVDIGRQDVGVSRAALEGAVRPVLIGVPRGLFMNEYRERTAFIMGGNERVRVPGTSDERTYADPAQILVEQAAEGTFVSVPFRNGGAGIAFIRGGWFRWSEPGSERGGEWIATAVPAGEVVRVSFLLDPKAGDPTLDQLTSYGTFSVLARYSDLAGNIWSSRLDVNRATTGHWEAVGVVLGHEGRTDEVSGNPESSE
jgi:hypothetical protein